MKKLIFALLPLLVGCTNVQNKGNDSVNTGEGQLVTFHLNAPPSKVEPLLLSEIADSVSYVALESKKETLTDMAIQCGDRYYTVINEERLLCFDKYGKYLHQVGRRGRGPDEYPWMTGYNDFDVDPANDWVYCNSNNYIQVYNENGKYVKSLTGGSWDYSPCYVYNYLAYFAPYLSPSEIIDGRNNLIVWNNKKTTEERKKFWKELGDKSNNQSYSRDGTHCVSFISNDEFYCWSVFYDTLMMAKGKEVKPVCLIIPENKYKPEDLYNKDNKSLLLQPIIQNMYKCKDKILLSVKYFASVENAKDYYSNKNKKYCYWVLCNFKNGNVTYHANCIINDLDGGPNILFPNSGREIYSLSVEDLKNDKEIYKSYFTDRVEAKLKDQEGKFQRLLESLADDANPIVRTFHWKEK